ncbi:hypothetical protein Isop_2830 [Isosphaera pallida ATCC 43644]|uniref:Uncharacterized protein n=1 Tax=Isosphaera pallida (strain ATCC 43644 / DSM 9630 / IS1B) TaxID=575540 RepID=E8R145_ISOPI|nr:hypothetical protein Isop_2830 [Isosphaera pallida ATCC 43644]
MSEGFANRSADVTSSYDHPQLIFSSHFFRPNSKLLIPYLLLRTPHSPNPTLLNPPHPTAHTPLPTPHCPLPTAHTPLPTAHCPLPTPYTPHPTPHTPHPTPHTPHPTLHSTAQPRSSNPRRKRRSGYDDVQAGGRRLVGVEFPARNQSSSVRSTGVSRKGTGSLPPRGVMRADQTAPLIDSLIRLAEPSQKSAGRIPLWPLLG